MQYTNLKLHNSTKLCLTNQHIQTPIHRTNRCASKQTDLASNSLAKLHQVLPNIIADKNVEMLPSLLIAHGRYLELEET